jgi:hypothetical protein
LGVQLKFTRCLMAQAGGLTDFKEHVASRQHSTWTPTSCPRLLHEFLHSLKKWQQTTLSVPRQRGGRGASQGDRPPTNVGGVENSGTGMVPKGAAGCSLMRLLALGEYIFPALPSKKEKANEGKAEDSVNFDIAPRKR